MSLSLYPQSTTCKYNECKIAYIVVCILLFNPRRACAARVTVVVPCVCVCVCVCFQGLHLRLMQLSDKLGILVVSVSCSLVFKFFSLFSCSYSVLGVVPVLPQK